MLKYIFEPQVVMADNERLTNLVLPKVAIEVDHRGEARIVAAERGFEAHIEGRTALGVEYKRTITGKCKVGFDN